MRVPQVNERVKEAPAHALRAMFAGIGQLLLITDRLRNRSSGAEQAEAPADEATPAEAATPAGTAAPAEAGGPAEAAPAEAREEAPGGSTATAPVAPEPAVTADAAPAPAATATEPAAKRSAPVKPAEPAKPAKPARSARAARPAAKETAPPSGNVRLLSPQEQQAQAAAAAASAAVPAAETTPGAEAPSGPGTTPAAGPPLPNYDELTIASLRARLRNLTVAQVRELAEYEKTHADRAEVIQMFERRITKLES
ncbi:MAG: hypothetical protein JOY82_01705 [Streptosporangiaceae bacterium]|nr:hypothetical protein [Streptosporangiaceae bacterium]MBV9853228.1 hypothetical protein [Streptosporangiaceae bacterium]